MLTVQQLELTHDNSKLIVVHTARRIDGQDRYGVGLIGTAGKQLLPWRTRLWEDNLQYVGGIQRIYGGDVAPDDSYFVVTSGSGGDRPPINDTAVAFRFGGGDNRQPMWISRAFDSIYSVAITEQAVYIGGHFQFNESPTAPDPWPGLDNVGYGTGQGLAAYALGDAVVRRDHLGALDPADGKALEWHPGSNSFEGNKAMIATPHGLLAGGDAGRQGEAAVGRVAFFDLDAAQAGATRITTPIQGRVVATEQQFLIQGDARSGALQKVQVEVQAGSQFLTEAGTWNGTLHRDRRRSRQHLGGPHDLVAPGHDPRRAGDHPPDEGVLHRRLDRLGEGDQEDRVVQLRRPPAEHKDHRAERLAPGVDLVRAARHARPTTTASAR